eukprot:517070-Rhodomonas_salina.1
MEVVLQGQDDQAVEAVQRMFSSAQDGLAIADPVDDDGLTVRAFALISFRSLSRLPSLPAPCLVFVQTEH